MLATFAVLALSGVAALLELHGRAAAAAHPVPGLAAPAPAADPKPAAPGAPASQGRAARAGLWVG